MIGTVTVWAKLGDANKIVDVPNKADKAIIFFMIFRFSRK